MFMTPLVGGYRASCIIRLYGVGSADLFIGTSRERIGIGIGRRCLLKCGQDSVGRASSALNDWLLDFFAVTRILEI
jgi:hypothetical protein